MVTSKPLMAVFLCAAMIVSGCVGTADVSRNAGPSLAPVIDVPVQNWDFVGLQVTVPQSLSVSEANSIKPRADIVWREGPAGDRHGQVAALMQAAMAPAFAEMQGAVPVQIDITVSRFHALTERARYTIGGEHEIEFVMTVRHAETGQLLSGPRDVVIEFRAYGGQQALDAEAQGITQSVRITQYLQDWIRREYPQTVVSAPAS